MTSAHRRGQSPVGDSPPHFLMCRPTYYQIAYEINPWMSLKRQVKHALAVTQWHRLYEVLTKQLGLGGRINI